MKVTSTTKDLVKQIIIDGEIKRFTAEETLAAIHRRGIKCGLTRLKQLKKEIKQDARDWITHLAKERNEYIALYKQGIDTFQRLQDVCYNIIENEEVSDMVKLVAVDKAAKIETEIIELYDALPVVKAITDTREEDIEQLQEKKP